MPDPRVAPAVLAVERALDWYLAEIPGAQARPVSHADAEGLRALLAGRRARDPRDFERLAAFAWTVNKLREQIPAPACNLGDAITALAQVEQPGEPAFTYDTTFDAEAFAKLGFQETSAGIARNQRENREGWWAHGQRNRAYITEAAGRTTGRDLAVVLGAGQAFDLPLADLARQFARLVLIDIDGPAMEQTVSGVLKDPALRSRAELRVLDLTGINRALLDRLEARMTAATAAEALDGIERLCHGYRLAPPPRLLAENERADLLVSSCVLTQLAWPQRSFAERLYQARFGGLHGGAEQRWARMWSELELKVQQDHFTALAGVAEVVAFTTDVLSHVTVLDAGGTERLSGESVPALGVPTLTDRIPQLFQADAHQSWAWPRYEAGPRREGSVMTVEALLLRDAAAPG